MSVLRVRSVLSSGPRAASVIASRGRGSRLVAKLIGEAGAPLASSLRDDAADLASLRHASLAVFDHAGRDPESGRGYIARPFIAGVDLDAKLRGEVARRSLPWLEHAALALRALHSFGILHRGVKTSNFIVGRRSSRIAPIVLTDPAWWRETAEPSTDERLAPEVRRGEPATFGSDLYSLGVVFYEVLTGRDFVLEDSTPEGSGFPVRPRRVAPDLSIDAERVVMRLVSPDPAKRYQDARDVVADLRRLIGRRISVSVADGDCFVGREETLSPYREALAAGAGPVTLAFVGPAGSGKSSVLRRASILAQLGASDVATISCRAESSTLPAICEAVVSASASSSRKRRLRSLLSGLEAIGAERSGASYEDVEAIERRDAFAWEFAEEVLSSLKMRRAVFAIDDVEAADPLTISVLSSIVRELSRRAATGEFPCHFLFAYRSEKGLREATDSLSRALRAAGGPNALVPLHALNGDETSEWLRWALDARPERYETLQRELERGALPSTIRGRLRRDTPSSAPSALDEIASAEGYEMSRRVLDVSAAIGRPAPLEFFSVVLDCELASLRSSVDELRSAGVLRESEEVVDLAVEELSDRWCEIRGQHALRAVHGDIARGLTPDTEAFPGEAASHALRSDEASAAIDAAFEAAASLVRRHDDRRALELYGCLEEVLGDDARARTAKRQCADALARTGQQRRAAEAYEALLADAEEGERGDLLSRLGASHHRAGDVALAVSQLERSLLELEDAVDDESFHARLHVWLELAEIHNSRGEYDDAERFCRLAIRSLDENEPVEVSASRRARMVALETLAHASLRRFRYGEAADYFERSLQASEDLGVVAERSLILNNLGILHNQENRFERAIECYEEAERLSARLGGDLILANIYSNLAVLYAKTAEPDEADEALRRAARHDEAGESTRTRCFRHHAAGLVDIYSGRYTSAIEALKVAIALAGEHKDRFLETFDLVYLAECHLYRGEIPAATAALDRVERLEAGDAVLAMVCARRAALAALAGESERAIEIVRSYPEPESAIPFLRAWDAYFLGWAARSVGDTELASKELPSAQRFFARTGVACGEVFAELELVALDGLRSRPVRALRRVRKLKARFRPGRGALRNAALSARLLVYEARALLESKTVDANEINQLLVEAESYLIGRHAQDLESLARSLRRALRERQPAAGLSTYVAVPELAGRRDEELYRSFREAGRELVAKLRGDSTASQTGGAEPAIREFEEQLARLQRQVEGRPDDRSATAKAEHLRGDSEATKRLREWVRRVAARELPVLIVGETGSGKDFVARAIHGESARRERPFVALNCAAVPRELLESELFGISAGAFTGAEENKAGLLASADGGTFFFDEVAEMDLELQAKLLRVLDRGVVRPVGSTEETRVDLRFVFATHRDLSSLAEEGKIRSDFFYRVRGLEIEVPPLRDRIEDLPLLIETFRADCGDPERLPRFESDGLAALSTYPWPGNVRELKNAVQNLVLTSAGSIRADDVERVLGERPEDGLFSPALLRSRPLPQLVEQLEKEYLVRLHADSNADLQVMAKTLGISLQALYARFKARGLKPKELKARFR